MLDGPEAQDAGGTRDTSPHPVRRGSILSTCFLLLLWFFRRLGFEAGRHPRDCHAPVQRAPRPFRQSHHLLGE